MTDKPRVVLIDLSSLWWAAYMVNAESGIREPRAITLAGVKQCVQPGELAVVCCDSGRSFRKELEPTYKANREKQPPAAYGELDKTKERLRADGYLLWESSGFEADDVIATACKMALDHGHEVRICSSDKDMLQLLNVKVDCLRTHTMTVVGPREVMEKFKVEPEQFRDFLALWGDSSDNVPGCNGIGQGRAAELLTQYDTIDRLYEAIDAGKDVPHMAKLRAGRDSVMLSRKLVELRYDVPLNFDEIYAERKPASLAKERDEKMADESDIGESPKDEPVTDASASGGSTSSDSQPTAALESIGTSAKPATELAQYVAPAAVEFERQLEPRSIRAAQYLADRLFDSRLYQRFNNADAIMAVIIRGREMGLGALTALDVFHMIEGKPYPHAYLLVARAKADPDCEYFQCVEASALTATWETKNRRNPKVTTCTFTIDQAKLSKLIRPGSGWEKNPEDMNVARAGAKLARREYPAAALGLYAWQEMDGEA